MWHGLTFWGALALALGFFGFGASRMNTDQLLAKTCFTLSAIILLARFGWWLAFELHTSTSRLVFYAFIIFGIIGSLWLISIKWVDHQPISQPKQPTAEEIAAEIAKRIPKLTPEHPAQQEKNKGQESKNKPTFKEVPRPFSVTVGNINYQIRETSSKKDPAKVFYMSGDLISAYLENNILYVDTTLYAGSNLSPVEIKHNQFTVKPPQWDRNFNNTALEIVDENLLPRLQFVYKNNRNVVITGIFMFPMGILVAEENRITINPTDPLTPRFRRIFKYPSRRFQGQELDEPHL
jgi:hypothetical protein